MQKPISQSVSGNDGKPYSKQIQTAILSELNRMLQAPIFAQSNRCKGFLRFVVTEALSGYFDQLKERTIGIAVFERPADYDTGDDAVVRVTANEVRKRIDQYYRESDANSLIHIELPKGAYVPEFRIHPVAIAASAESSPPTEPGKNQAGPDPALLAQPAEPPAESGPAPLPLTSPADPIEPLGRNRPAVWAVLFLLVAALVAVSFWLFTAQRHGPDVWKAFQRSNAPTLICVGAHDLIPGNTSRQGENDRFASVVLERQIIPVDDAAVVGSMAGMLGSKGIRFRVAGAEETSPSNFRMQPVVLIGALGNRWTLRLLQSLRYRLQVENDTDSILPPKAAIYDSEHPAQPLWTIDFATPLSTWKNDYAIVARVDDPATGVPVLIEAGLGAVGSLAGSEWISSGAMSKSLDAEPACRARSNFEAVIGSAIIDGKSGAPQVLRLLCW